MRSPLKPENCPHYSLWKERMAGGSTGDYICRICGDSGYGEEWAEAHRRTLAARDPGALGYRASIGDVRLGILPAGEGEWEYSVANAKTHGASLPSSGPSVERCKEMAMRMAVEKYPDQADQDWIKLVWRPIEP
jgi:hypothetical protein